MKRTDILSSSRARAAFFVLLFLLACLASAELPAHRPFYMGFTTWPYDFTQEAVDATYDTIAAHSDLVTFHLDRGVPWPEAAAGTPFHPNVQSELDRMLAESHRFEVVYVSVTPQSTDRVSLAGYWGEETDSPLPPDWQGRSFDDPIVVSAYLAYCQRIIDLLHPDYFAYGIEVNANYLPDEAAFTAFRGFVAEIYDALRSDYPDLPIFLTFQTGSFVSSPEQQREVEEALLPYTDLIGLSTYPYLVGGVYQPDRADMSYLPEDWFERMAELAPDKPFAITETGYIAETLSIPEFLIETEGREEWQELYLRFLLEKASELDTEFVTYWQIRDYDLGYEFLQDLGLDDPVFLIWKDIGLLDGEGRSRSGLGVWDSWLALPHIPAGSGATTCTGSETRLCLAENRFQLEVTWRDHQGETGQGRVAPARTEDSGIFYFFGSDNWELMVKVLDGCSLTDHFWVFAAATTDVAYTLEVTDTANGAVARYSNPLGRSSPAITDTAALATCELPGPTQLGGTRRSARRAMPIVETAASTLEEGSCTLSATTFCLNEGRFEVQVDWESFTGDQGKGHIAPGATDDSGVFYFFGPNNWELMVKVLDGCALNQRFWVFAAATTNVGYSLRVRDTLAEAAVTYSNPLGTSSAAITDTDALATCSGVLETPNKIVPPPGGGLYIGQYEWAPGDIATFEAAVGQRAALWYDKPVFEEGRFENGQVAEAPQFSALAAEDAWNDGKVVLAGAWDGVDLAETGIGIDRVLSGELDPYLEDLAGQFRAFGKPFFFMSAREPNGIGLPYLGGFGPDGTESQWWAIDHQKALDQFHPSELPNPALYEGLGDPEICDGAERLAALQRYYHDFFVRRQGLEFITFDGLGWGSLTVDELWPGEYEERGYGGDAYARRVAESCLDYANAYPGDPFVDWVSMTFYMLDFYAADWPGLDDDILVPDSYYLDALDSALAQVERAAPTRPVLFIELGFPDGRKTDSEIAARKVRAFFDHILDRYPQIRGFSMWSWAEVFDDPASPFYFPYDCLLRPGSAQGDALRAIIEARPSHFHSCAYTADGNLLPACAVPSNEQFGS